MNVDRRNFLKGAGVAIALPLLESMPTLRAAQKAAKSAGPVKRFVCLSNNYGIYKKGFFPAAAGTDYALPPTLKPLERHRRDFTVFSNLDHGNTGGTKVCRCCSVVCGRTWRQGSQKATSASTKRWLSMLAQQRGFLR